MFTLRYQGDLWSYAFLKCGFLTQQGREDFLHETLRAYSNGQARTRISGDGFEGEIRKGKQHTIGGIAGDEYLASLDTTTGKQQISILVKRKINPHLN